MYAPRSSKLCWMSGFSEILVPFWGRLQPLASVRFFILYHTFIYIKMIVQTFLLYNVNMNNYIYIYLYIYMLLIRFWNFAISGPNSIYNYFLPQANTSACQAFLSNHKPKLFGTSETNSIKANKKAIYHATILLFEGASNLTYQWSSRAK